MYERSGLQCSLKKEHWRINHSVKEVEGREKKAF